MTKNTVLRESKKGYDFGRKRGGSLNDAKEGGGIFRKW